VTDVGTDMSAGEVRAVVEAVESRASEWLGADGPVQVSLRSVDHRKQSTLLRLDVEADGCARRLIAKLPKAVAATGGLPGLVPPVDDPLRKALFEHSTLVVVAGHFRSLGDPRFGALGVHGHLPGPGAVVVDEIDLPTLHQILRAGPRGSRAADPSDVVLRHLGGWLAEFHQLRTAHAEPRGGTLPDLQADLRRLRDLLTRAGRAEWMPPALGTVVDQVLPGTVATRLATGLGHGDVAPRNVFVGEGGRVVVIDSLGRFVVPVHEDLAYLLTELATGSVRFGRRRPPASGREVARLRAALLEGYGLVDDPTLWAFELRSLLDKWRSLAGRRRSSGTSGRARRAANGLRERLIGRQVSAVCRRMVASC
jgi:hypothetical protein